MLAGALDQIVDRIIQGTLDDLAPYRPPPFPVPAADRVTLFVWRVLTCYPGELAAQMQTVDLGAAEADLANQQQQQQQPMVNGNGPVLVANNQEDNAVPQLD
jgi:beta-1,4-N-acetylglucosaminyltransferase